MGHPVVYGHLFSALNCPIAMFLDLQWNPPQPLTSQKSPNLSTVKMQESFFYNTAQELGIHWDIWVLTCLGIFNDIFWFGSYHGDKAFIKFSFNWLTLLSTGGMQILPPNPSRGITYFRVFRLSQNLFDIWDLPILQLLAEKTIGKRGGGPPLGPP